MNFKNVGEFEINRDFPNCSKLKKKGKTAKMRNENKTKQNHKNERTYHVKTGST